MQLEPGTNILVGFNGVGKTNIAEAINYFATQSSHRVSYDAPLVRIGAEQAIIRARLHTGERAVALELEINPGKSNRIAINRGAPQPARTGLGLVRSVLFAPEDLALVNGEPAVRRRFLDELMVQLRPVLGDAKKEYDRVLKQRNALLKNARRSGKWTEEHDATLMVWDEHLARAGARLLNGRLNVLQLLAAPLAEAYAELSDSPKGAGFYYESAMEEVAGQHVVVPDEGALYKALLARLQEAHQQERDRGVTLVGPHRDDVVLTLGPAPAKGFASHGETWSMALALRLASFQVLVADNPDETARPILILDDVFAELDAKRRSALARMTHDAEQVIVTAAVAEDLPAELTGPRIAVQMTEGVSTAERVDTDE